MYFWKMLVIILKVSYHLIIFIFSLDFKDSLELQAITSTSMSSILTELHILLMLSL